MSLRDIDALHEWATQRDPPYSIWLIVSTWVAGLDSTPWQAPSVPFEELARGRVVVAPYYDLPGISRNRLLPQALTMAYAGTT